MKLNKKELGFLSFGAALVILMLSMSFAQYLIEPCNSNFFVNYATGNIVNCLQTLPAGTTAQNGVVAGINDQLITIFGGLGLGTAALIAFSAAFPNGYAIFAAAAYFLLGGGSMPVNLFNASSGLPDNVRIFLVLVFSLLNMFAVLSYLGAKNY